MPQIACDAAALPDLPLIDRAELRTVARRRGPDPVCRFADRV
jgi:hypothetical protein